MMMVWPPDGKRLLSTGYDGTLRLWDVGSGKELKQIPAHQPHTYCAAFSPDGKRLVSGGCENTVRVWDAATGKELHKYVGHTASVLSVTFFPDGDEVWATFTETGAISGTDDGTGATYSGHATAWGNFNLNERNTNSAFTLMIHATGSDGSSITAHETTMFGVNANGQVTVNFDKASLTCG